MSSVDLPAIIDVSIGGSLLGIELSFAGLLLDTSIAMRRWLTNPDVSPMLFIQEHDTVYIELSISNQPDVNAVRSVTATVSADLVDGFVVAVTLPRQGNGYEISYPSGNR